MQHVHQNFPPLSPDIIICWKTYFFLSLESTEWKWEGYQSQHHREANWYQQAIPLSVRFHLSLPPTLLEVIFSQPLNFSNFFCWVCVKLIAYGLARQMFDVITLCVLNAILLHTFKFPYNFWREKKLRNMEWIGLW